MRGVREREASVVTPSFWSVPPEGQSCPLTAGRCLRGQQAGRKVRSSAVDRRDPRCPGDTQVVWWGSCWTNRSQPQKRCTPWTYRFGSCQHVCGIGQNTPGGDPHPRECVWTEEKAAPSMHPEHSRSEE